MLDKKATDLTSDVLISLCLNPTSHDFISIQPIIREALISIYLQGRKDQANKVLIIEGPDGSITFPTK